MLQRCFRVMNRMFSHLDLVLVYLHGIIVFSKSHACWNVAVGRVLCNVKLLQVSPPGNIL